MWTHHPKHKMANSGFLFNRTPFDRKYPHPFNDLFWRVHATHTTTVTVRMMGDVNLFHQFDRQFMQIFQPEVPLAYSAS